MCDKKWTEKKKKNDIEPKQRIFMNWDEVRKIVNIP